MNDVTFNLLKIVISVVMALIAFYVIPYLKTLVQDAKYKRLLEVIETAVRAAEQTITGSGMGKIKKNEVIQSVTAWMIEHGIEITDKQLSDLIEAVVFTMNNVEKQNGK